MIRFEHVGLRYGVGPEVLTDVNFTLEPGSFHFLSGPSGSGKTSVMNLMILAQRPTRGLINMFGQNINGLSRQQLGPFRQRIGMVFQDFRLLPHLSVFDNVALPLRVQEKPEKEIRTNVNELLGMGGVGGTDAISARDVVGRAEAAGGDCAGRHHAATFIAGGRADRESRR